MPRRFGQPRWRRRARRRLAWGVWPVALSALLFAALHTRVESPAYGAEFLRFWMIGGAALHMSTVAFAVALARWMRGATAADLGWAPSRIVGDVGLGLTAFAGVAAPIYAAQIVLLQCLPDYIAPDPFVLFPFAVALGVLYFRTHRIVPSMTLHAALNATTLAMLWLKLP